MTFVSIPFVILFIITALLIWKVKSLQGRQVILLIASYIFYAYWDVRFLLLLIGQTYISFALAKLIARTRDERIRKRYCATGVVISLCILGFFKYFNFFRDSLLVFTNGSRRAMWSIILPIGISFYTFQAMSYLIDVYRKKVTAREHFITVSLYISFFPQLVAGPIVRASDFLPQLDENHDITFENVEKAIQIFVIGLFKKIVIADRLAVCVDAVFAAPVAYDGISIVLAVFSYAMQIYCDFSGYSDMAIGVAKFFGYDLCKNFDLPYFSQNPTEFWKRWHISLSSLLQDYLYIPLGGNRKGKVRTYINLMFTMLLGGLWHGANWTFVVWGALHGCALMIHKLIRTGKRSISNNLNSKKCLNMLINFVFICICLIFFRAETIENATLIIQRIFTGASGIHYVYIYTIIYGVLLFIVQLFMYVKNNGHAQYPKFSLTTWKGKFALCMMAWIIFLFAYGGETAFVYFQF